MEISEIINRHRHIISLREDLRKKEEELFALTDNSLIVYMKCWFEELNGSDINNAKSRQMFIFIILMFYSPSSLLGRRMPHGLRKYLARILNVKSDHLISQDANNLLFTYNTYKNFKEEIDRIYDEIKSRIPDIDYFR